VQFHEQNTRSYPVELSQDREAGDGEVGEGEVVDLLRRVVSGELSGHDVEEGHVVRARETIELRLRHLRRSAAEHTLSPA
jgi:hypothetical protein